MNHAVEYFHTLVEHEFTRDQYEVSYDDGKYHVTIDIPYDGYSPMSYYVYTLYQKKMVRCVRGLIKPENLEISVVLPIKLVNENIRRYYDRTI